MLLSWGHRSIELRPVGYQFPDYPNAGGEWDWDANWLMIRGEVQDGDVTWHFVDPCLTTRDAREVLEWMMAVADGRPPSRHLAFLEPNLQFEVMSWTEREIALAVFFAQESSPPGSVGETRFGEGHRVPIWLDPDSLRRAADQWRDEIAAYPER